MHAERLGKAQMTQRTAKGGPKPPFPVPTRIGNVQAYALSQMAEAVCEGARIATESVGVNGVQVQLLAKQRGFEPFVLDQIIASHRMCEAMQMLADFVRREERVGVR
jgi:hypothetical protein